ncbi:Minor histocompatibility antigen H13 [Symbiodinium microadriaticum]|uniref:Minor histocompatibility antigen H13 n=1 Tax=Symbiodinium microadriaticum TaxID=2951 RepID=A0A1Q9EC35_SYMMI|nr:Minor histocompatibility antigen H13 [Symbiodinium microadriaticum]
MVQLPSRGLSSCFQHEASSLEPVSSLETKLLYKRSLRDFEPKFARWSNGQEFVQSWGWSGSNSDEATPPESLRSWAERRRRARGHYWQGLGCPVGTETVQLLHLCGPAITYKSVKVTHCLQKLGNGSQAFPSLVSVATFGVCRGKERSFAVKAATVLSGDLVKVRMPDQRWTQPVQAAARSGGGRSNCWSPNNTSKLIAGLFAFATVPLGLVGMILQKAGASAGRGQDPCLARTMRNLLRTLDTLAELRDRPLPSAAYTLPPRAALWQVQCESYDWGRDCASRDREYARKCWAFRDISALTDSRFHASIGQIVTWPASGRKSWQMGRAMSLQNSGAAARAGTGADDAGPKFKKRSASPKPHAASNVSAVPEPEVAKAKRSLHGSKQRRIRQPAGLRSNVLRLYCATACCFMIFGWIGEALRQEIPAGKFQKMDKSLIDIKDFDVYELGPFPKCHEHFGEHLVSNGGADQWAKNSDVPHGGPYPPGHPENPEWLSKSASSKQAGDRFGQLQAQVQLVLLPALCVMLASKQSLWLFTSEQAAGTVAPVLEQQDAYWLPVLGSGALFGLFVVIKFLGHDWLKHAITTVMVWISAFGMASNIDTVAHLVRNKRGCLVSFAQLEISLAHVFGMPAAAVLAVAYVSTGHWIVNNILGFSFCLLGIRSINLSSYGAGVVLLSGLFVYDVFWVFFSKPVFGANVMVSVAKGVEAPIKLMLPRDFGGCGDLQFNMLGLGDIAVPGLFASFLAKWDAVNIAAGSSKSFVYLNFCLLAYMLSLILTVTVMMIFQHAQPALLYICPCVLLASLAVARARGELTDLIAFSIPEEGEAEGIQSSSSDAGENESTKRALDGLGGLVQEAKLHHAQ